MQTIGERAVVGTKGVALVGVSGHQLAFLPSGAAVLVHGVLGSYTRVSHDGRTGLILTDDLQGKASRRASITDEMPEDATSEPKAQLPPGIRWVARAWAPLLLSLAAIGGSGAVFFGLL